METLLQAVLGLALLWLGLKPVELSSHLKTSIWVADFLLLAISIVSLGWLGLGILLLANLVGFLGWSLHLAMKKESLLVYAASQAGCSKNDMLELHDRLYGGHKAFRLLGPIKVAELLKRMSERGRDLNEIEEMAQPIALLHVAHKVALEEVTDKFDQLLRLYGEPAGKAMSVADKLTKSAQLSAATFEEMLDSAIAATMPGSDADPDEI